MNLELVEIRLAGIEDLGVLGSIAHQLACSTQDDLAGAGHLKLDTLVILERKCA